MQQHVDLALLDDAVGVGGHARAGEQVADVAQPAGLAVDEILALAAAVDAAGDVDFGGVDGELARRVVEGERDLGRVGLPPAAAEPLKMTSAISLPRRLLTLCSPSTHLMASTTLDLPEPLGPTTTVMPAGNSNRVLSAKLLKPTSSRALSMLG